MKADFKVRLQPGDVAASKNPNHKHAAKIFIHPSTFAQAGFQAAHLCNVETDGGLSREAVAWPAPDKNVANNIASLSRIFMKTAGLELGQMIRLTPGAGPVPDAQLVVVRETTTSNPEPLPSSEEQLWAMFLKHRLEVAEYILPGTSFDDIYLEGSTRSFLVESVNGSRDTVAKYKPHFTAVEFFEEEANGVQGDLKLTALPAMARPIEQLNDLFSEYNAELGGQGLLLNSCGIVLHGSHGTGKTTLLNHIADTNWGRLVRISNEDKPSKIESSFEAALKQRTPTIILIDDIPDLVGKDVANKDRYINVIGKGLDALAQESKRRQMKPNVLVVATCLDYFSDIPYALTTSGRFEDHIRLPVPDERGREEVIRSWTPAFTSEMFENYISRLAERTHAYTPADLRKTLRTASRCQHKRTRNAPEQTSLQWEDIVTGIQENRPSAMRDIDLKPPIVRWEDIGGYENVKVSLQRVLRRPKPGQKIMYDLTKGILLYGPPGCSKTMTAQAMATESGYNFFAVKGGELLNMYVGETERAIRNLFQRARDASPSIIFFDEIDSIAGSRSGFGGTSSSGGGVQALTTLLNEMDGFEVTGDVFVLAATNKPDALDPALIRPGRFDELIYVPLPDMKAREAIIANKTKKLGILDANVAELARQTEGYSGAEVASICGKAFKEVDDCTNLSSMEVLEAAVRETPKLVSRDILFHFEAWKQKFK
ncbi:AAA-domain-containing protein [Xylariaceae sp. FL0016]|nr:AAA-domain-containing protein [Xylariaceae sp. FL0016]